MLKVLDSFRFLNAVSDELFGIITSFPKLDANGRIDDPYEKNISRHHEKFEGTEQISEL